MHKHKQNHHMIHQNYSNLADENVDFVFVQKKGADYEDVFQNVKAVASLCDDFFHHSNCLQRNMKLEI